MYRKYDVSSSIVIIILNSSFSFHNYIRKLNYAFVFEKKQKQNVFINNENKGFIRIYEKKKMARHTHKKWGAAHLRPEYIFFIAHKCPEL